MKRHRIRRRSVRCAGPINAEALESRTLLSAYAITDLGSLPGFTGSEATAMNSSGQVVGDVRIQAATVAFLWTPGGTSGPVGNQQMQSLGTLGGSSSEALGINDAGQVVGWADDTDGNEQAFLWTPGGTAGPVSNPQMQNLGTLGGASGVAFGINTSGQVVGEAEISGPSADHAFLWTAGATNGIAGNPQMLDLGTLGTMPGIQSTATAVADDGQVVGWADNDNFNPQPFLWTAGGTAGPVSNPQMQNLGTLSGPDGQANGINAAGQVTGWSSLTGGSGNPEAFLWTPNGTAGPVSNPQMQDLGNIDGFGSQANGLNNAGQTVGDFQTTQSDPAFIYDSDNSIQDLNTIAPVAATSWTLNTALAINNSGQIVGDGVSPQGNDAFLLVPAPPTAAFAASPAAVTVAGGTTEAISVTYASIVEPIDTSSIGATNLTVANSSGVALTVSVTNITGSGDSVTANYAVAAPGGSWQTANNDTYSVQVNANSVTDIDGNGAAAISTSFPVAIPYASLPTGNLLMNPGAEGGSDTDPGTVTGWTAGGDAMPGRDNGSLDGFTPHTGGFDFSAQEGNKGTLTQVVDLTGLGSAPLAAIDSGNTIADAGFFEQTLDQGTPSDGGEVQVTFQNAAHQLLAGGYDSGQIANIGGWKDVTGFADVPAGTRFIQYQMVFTLNQGLDLDAFIDDNSLVISSATPATGVDTTFASGLPIVLPFSAETVLQEPGGQILAVGHTGSTTNNTSQGELEQLTGDGILDSTFGSGGTVATDVSINAAYFGAAIQSNGQIVAVGGSNGSFLVARYNTDGSLDSSFGTAGFVEASFAAVGTATAASVQIEPDGTIVVGGQAGGVLALARFTAGGALDTSFNPGGADDANFPAGGQLTVSAAGPISQVLVQGNGQILCEASTGGSVQVLRCGTDGSVDSTFGTAGAMSVTQLSPTDPNNKPVTPSMAFQPGGALLVASETSTGAFGAVRLSPTGQADPTFGVSGIASATFGGTTEDLNSIVVNPLNGEFLLVGTTNVNGTTEIAIAAFNNDGTVNTTFGDNGQFTLAAPGTLTGQSLNSPPGRIQPAAFHPLLTNYALATFQSDGKVIVAASGVNSANVVRLPPITPATATIGNFGKVNGKNVKLAPITLANGTVVTITMQGGAGTASHVGNQISLTLTGSVAVTMKAKGGTGLFTLADITESGNLRTFNAPAATLNGTLSATGTIGALKLGGIAGVVISAGGISNLTAGSVSGSISATGVLVTAKLGVVSGTIAAAQIRNFTSTSLANATILAGANLGTDGQLGGAADSFGPGQINNLKVTGAVASSFIGAGVNPIDALFGDSDDALAGTGIIKAVTVKGGIDAKSHFEAGIFPKTVHLPAKVLTAGNAQFVVLH